MGCPSSILIISRQYRRYLHPCYFYLTTSFTVATRGLDGGVETGFHLVEVNVSHLCRKLLLYCSCLVSCDRVSCVNTCRNFLT